MRRVHAAVAAGTALLVLTACGPRAATVSSSDVDVATPALQQAKQAAGIAACVPGGASAPATDGLPDLTLPCLGGGPAVDLDTLQGPLVINLWASNCAPCREELPALQAYSEAYGHQVPVLGIDWVDTRPAAAIQLLADSGVTYPQLADPGGDLLDQPSLPLAGASPQFLLIGADGQVAAKRAGGLTDVAQVKAMVEQGLGVTL